MNIREELGSRLVVFAQTWTLAEGWEWVHEQTFERAGLVLTTRKAMFRETKACFEAGREVERERWNPKPAPKPGRHLGAV